MVLEKQIDSKTEYISEAVKFIKGNLESLKVKPSDNLKIQLLAEEFLAQIISSKGPDEREQIRISLQKRLRNCSVIISYKGRRIEELKNVGLGVDLSEAEMPPDAEAAIRDRILSANEDSYSIGYKNGINKISIQVENRSRNSLRDSALALLLACLAGVFFRFAVPREISLVINTNVLSVIKTIFVNALMLVTGPVVFFSIASCISMFTDMKELGKIAAKVIGFYLFTSVLAVGVGFAFSYLFHPGTFGELIYLSSGEVVKAEAVTAADMILGIIPQNFISPFLELNTLQIIVMALLLGLGASKMGEKSPRINEVLKSLNDLVLKITGLIIKFLPLMVFSSITSIFITIELDHAASILVLVAEIIVCMIVMMTLYVIIVWITTGTSPKKFIPAIAPAWLNAFVLQSSNAAMPGTMDMCHNNLKVSPKIYSFSIPLGATINMDAVVLGQISCILFFAKVFGINMGPADYTTLILTTLILSVGCPGIPGSGVIVISVLMSQVGIPAAALPIYLTVGTIMDPMGTANNVFGDITGTYVIAKRNNLMQE